MRRRRIGEASRREAACRQTSHLLANDRFTKTSVMRSPLALAKPSLYDPVSIV
ncbi:MAG: hypothetical protein V7K90_31085 [Nostoc sp.]|uniref:hypothetical protein n=1 Tax=Nostoc sp. TaxID=1180 RepID=UPI002FF64C73